jgi:hypothetical protein
LTHKLLSNNRKPLSITHPLIAAEWDHSLNSGITPEDVSAGSGKKFWFKCAKGHIFDAVICNRRNGQGCPYCANRRICSDNNLQATFSKIAKEWHPTKNGKITPKDVIPGSCKSYWFKCELGHEWEVILAKRTKRGDGCPYCSNNRLSKENCLQAKFPKLAKEWHPTKNGKITPKDVVSGSRMKYWFKCSQGHDWKTNLSNRTGKLTGCPYCDGKLVCKSNCLQANFPKIAIEWHPTKNGKVTPKDVVAGSHKSYWFKCSQGHDWKANLGDRTSKKPTGCPFCAGRKVCKENSLHNNFPKIAKEWHPTKNGKVTPKDVVAGSHKSYWFKCSQGHDWKCRLYGRTRGGSGCPYCDGKLVCKSNCLQTRFPKVAKEWHPTKNGKITPRDVVSGSRKYYWFKCELNHEWRANLDSRTRVSSDCPYCPIGKTEEEVRKIFQSLLGIPFPKSRFPFLGRQSFDGANETIKLAFEYDGEFHDRAHFSVKSHLKAKSLAHRIDLDARKDSLSKENGWTLIRVHYSDRFKLEEVIKKKLIKAGFKIKRTKK